MDEEKSNFSKPDELIIVVRKLTPEIITEALEAYAEDNGFWLKLHQFASEIDISIFDELQAKHVKESIKFNLLCGLDDLEEEINKFDQLNNAEKSNLAAKIEKLAILSIIREDGVHISSFSLDDDAVRKLVKDGFWVLKKRNL